jgi:spoIIIJ-associated protein
MYNSVRKTAPTVSAAVMEFLQESNNTLDSISANLVAEKIFTDKKEYTVEFYVKNRSSDLRPAAAAAEDIEYAKSVLLKLMQLMRFSNYTIDIKQEKDQHILKVCTNGKDGLIIGKNGQNLIALQYLLSIALDKKFHRHIPVIIDVDDYRDKRIAYLKNLTRTMCDTALEGRTEVITDFLPSYERKLIHEEVSSNNSLKTFSVGKGPYKKVVITALL